jgi:hypothetical protein
VQREVGAVGATKSVTLAGSALMQTMPQHCAPGALCPSSGGADGAWMSADAMAEWAVIFMSSC